MLCVIAISGYLFIQYIFSFLSPNSEISAEAVVIEGWISDYDRQFSHVKVASEVLMSS
jgi:hypothetical protein